MARLEALRPAIEGGYAALRRYGRSSALVYLQGDVFVVTDLDGTYPEECLDWAAVLDTMGDWAEYEDWQRYVRREVFS